VRAEDYAYDQEYIRHLVEKIDKGEYAVEMLTPLEEEQIQNFLNSKQI